MNATTLESRFISLSPDDIKYFVEQNQEENVHLDFKTVSSHFQNVDDKRTLAKALSGFANSDGGIIIWGINARRMDNQIDGAAGIVPITNIKAFVSRLNSLTSDFVNPTVGGVQHRIVYENEDGAGCAATLVPASDCGPHMAKAGDDRYYKRSGDSFIRLEHFDIADMFGRRPSPTLKLHADITNEGTLTGPKGTLNKARVIFYIINNGRGSAFGPYLSVTINDPYHICQYGVDGNGHEGLPRLATRSRGTTPFGSSMSMAIHPGMKLDVFAVRQNILSTANNTPDILVNYSIAADGLGIVSDVLKVRGSDIVRHFK